MTSAPPILRIGDLELEAMSEIEAAFLPDDVDQYFEHGIRLSPGDTVFDVGANIGAFSAAAKQHAGGALSIVAFEPVPEVFAVLQRNLQNHFGEGARAFQIGLADREAEIELTYYPHMTLLSSLHRGQDDAESERARLTRTFHAMIKEGRIFPLLRVLPDDFLEALVDGHVAQALQQRTTTARLRTLSAVRAELGIETIHLLKIDVEGAELDVLRGVAEADWPRIQQVVLEVERFATRADAVTSLLSGQGFAVTPVQDEVQTAGDFGLVYARRG